MRCRLASVSLAATLALLLAPAASAGPLTVVRVNAPAYNYVFSPSGTVVVQDTDDTFAISGAAGLARLQSRTTRGLPGAPAAGLYDYEYRLDLTNAYGILNVPCITSLTLRFGSVIDTLDYNGDGTADQMYVVASGGLGSVGVASASETGSYLTVTFADGGVCAGSNPGGGQSSLFFGLVSANAPTFVSATLHDNLSLAYTVQARAPITGTFYVSDTWVGILQRGQPIPLTRSIALHIGAVRARRLEGTLSVSTASDGAPVVLSVQGSLSASGRLHLASRSRTFVAAAQQDGDSPLFTGRYHLKLGDGPPETGTFTLTLNGRFLPAVQIEP